MGWYVQRSTGSEGIYVYGPAFQYIDGKKRNRKGRSYPLKDKKKTVPTKTSKTANSFLENRLIQNDYFSPPPINPTQEASEL